MIWVALIFIGGLLLGLPLAFVMGMTGVAHLITLGNEAFVNVIPQRLFMGINNITLSCLPFFIIAGQIMNVGGITRKLMDAARDCVGHLKGGLAYTTLLVSVVLSAIIGAAQAVASILCTVLLPEMKRDGYEPEFSASLISAAGVLGPIIPPSVVFVTYSVRANVSVKGLFMAGIIPGICIAVGYALVIFLKSRKEEFPAPSRTFSVRALLKSFAQAIPALMIPLIIIGGIMTGFCTPTESGALAVVAAIVVGLCYRTLDLRKLPKIFLDAGITSAGIMFVVSFGNVIGWTMAMGGIPDMIQSWIFGVTEDPRIILFIMLLVLIVVGCLLDVTAASLLFVPVMCPLAAAIGLPDIHWGVIFCVMLCIGFITPPVGQVLFVVSNVSDVSFAKLSKNIIPFCLVAFVVTFILAYCPAVTMWLPNIFG